MKRFIVDFKSLKNKPISTLGTFYTKIGLTNYITKNNLQINIRQVRANKKTIEKIKTLIFNTYLKYEVSMNELKVIGKRKVAYSNMEAFAKYAPNGKGIYHAIGFMLMNYLPYEDNTLSTNEIILNLE